MTTEAEIEREPGEDLEVRTDDRKVTWGYTRKTRPAEYEAEEASIYVTDRVPADVPDGAILAWVAGRTPAVFDALRLEVWPVLNIPFQLDDTGHPFTSPMIGQHASTQPPAQEYAPEPPPEDDYRPAPLPERQPPPPPSREPRDVGQPGPPREARVPKEDPSMAQYGVPAQRPRFCGEGRKQGEGCGGQDFYDNRSENDGKILKAQKIGPDWKCKSCELKYYRPGSYPYNKALG